MYSIVLMATLTVGADTPDFGHRRGRGCSGYSSCCGSYGGYGRGYGCSGGYGGGYGCYGGYGGYGGYGCSGGMGYGGGCYGGYGGYGGYGCSGGMVYGGGYGGYGCYGGMGYGGMVICSGGVIPGGGGTTNGGGKTNGGTGEKDLTADEKARFDELTKTWDAAAKEKMLRNLRKLDAAGREETFKIIEEESKKGKGKDKEKEIEKEVSVPTPASLVVVLPADATLKIDQAATTSTTSRRVFVTPPLAPGQTFHYTLAAEVVRDGVRVTQTQQVPVRAGQRSRVLISFPEAGVAQR